MDIFETYNQEFHFTLDAAASLLNAKAPLYFGKKQNGLKQSWGNHIVWCNPPGDRDTSWKDWIMKAHAESKTGALTVMQLPAMVNTDWFMFCCKNAEVRFIETPEKIRCKECGQGLNVCVVIFRPGAGASLGLNHKDHSSSQEIIQADSQGID